MYTLRTQTHTYAATSHHHVHQPVHTCAHRSVCAWQRRVRNRAKPVSLRAACCASPLLLFGALHCFVLFWYSLLVCCCVLLLRFASALVLFVLSPSQTACQTRFVEIGFLFCSSMRQRNWLPSLFRLRTLCRFLEGVLLPRGPASSQVKTTHFNRITVCVECDVF